MRSLVLEDVRNSTSFKYIEKIMVRHPDNFCDFMNLLESKMSQKFLEACNDTNDAIIKAALIEISYGLSVDYNIPYQSVYACDS